MTGSVGPIADRYLMSLMHRPVPVEAPGLNVLPRPRSGSRTGQGSGECLSQSRACDAVVVQLAGANLALWC